jgi:hypothetical protein
MEFREIMETRSAATTLESFSLENVILGHVVIQSLILVAKQMYI